MQSEAIKEIYLRQVDMVWRISFTFLKNREEAKDAVQETFLRLMKSGQNFQDEKHEKAWMIVTASNVCKDMKKHWWQKKEALEDHEMECRQEPYEINEVLEAVLALPEKYKVIVYLYYYEGFRTGEIADQLKKPYSTVRNQLGLARKLLKKRLGDEFDAK